MRAFDWWKRSGFSSVEVPCLSNAEDGVVVPSFIEAIGGLPTVWFDAAVGASPWRKAELAGVPWRRVTVGVLFSTALRGVDCTGAVPTQFTVLVAHKLSA